MGDGGDGGGESTRVREMNKRSGECNKSERRKNGRSVKKKRERRIKLAEAETERRTEQARLER